MLGTKLRSFAPIIEQSLEDLVPADNFYRFLDRVLDLTFVRELVGGFYADIGRPSIDPVVFFRLQLVLFFEGIRSERQLMTTVADRLSVRWYLGYDFGQSLPDHSSLTRIRERYGLPIFEQFFEHVVELCVAAGLVWGKELIFDATKVRANADVDSLVPRFSFNAKAHLAELFATAAEPTEAEEPAIPAVEATEDSVLSNAEQTEPRRLPTALTPDAEAQLVEEQRIAPKLLQDRRLDPERAPRHEYQRQTAFRVSTTDPDAALMFSKAEGTRFGYHDHYVVDGGKARIILNALVTPADIMENQPMLDLLWRAQFRWKLHPKRIVADTTYSTYEIIRAVADAGIRAYVPIADWDRTPFYGPSRFTFDHELDEYRCPQDQPLHPKKTSYTKGVVIYQAEATTCNTCPVKTECTTSDRGRQLHRSFTADYMDRVRSYHDTPAYEKAMKKRKVWIEPLFGEAKDWHGLRRFRLRGIEKVNIQGQLIAAGQNLKRWLSQKGWGRRLTPNGTLLFVAPNHQNQAFV